MALARPTSIALLTTHRAAKRVFTLFAVSYSSSSSSKSSRALILYSKPGCCLCDGLKEKLQAAFLLSGPDSLHDVDLQIRDITSNPEWERAYQYEIPVLARVLSDGTEETLPRLSPRLGVEMVQKKIAAALKLKWVLDSLWIIKDGMAVHHSNNLTYKTCKERGLFLEKICC